MSDITFTPEQVTEIRRRIEESQQAQFGACDEGAFGRVRAEGIRAVCINLLSRFPLPKVTRFRTFTRVDTYRVRDCVVEFEAEGGVWKRSGYGNGSVESFAQHMARFEDWTTLAALADVAASPTEEVDA